MLEYKQSVAARVAVRLLDSSGNPVTGVAFGSVTAAVEKSDGTTAVVTVTGSDWVEITAGAFSGQGVYNLIIPSSALNLTGILIYAVSTASAKYFGTIKVVAKEEIDTWTFVDTLHEVALGKWKIEVTGADANRLILYKQDGSTVVKKFNLKDSAGDATFVNPFSREPV